eukprot:1036763-Pelagomonas_calceolata.AAC.9
MAKMVSDTKGTQTEPRRAAPRAQQAHLLSISKQLILLPYKLSACPSSFPSRSSTPSENAPPPLENASEPPLPHAHTSLLPLPTLL